MQWTCWPFVLDLFCMPLIAQLISTISQWEQNCSPACILKACTCLFLMMISQSLWQNSFTCFCMTAKLYFPSWIICDCDYHKPSNVSFRLQSLSLDWFVARRLHGAEDASPQEWDIWQFKWTVLLLHNPEQMLRIQRIYIFIFVFLVWLNSRLCTCRGHFLLKQSPSQLKYSFKCRS